MVYPCFNRETHEGYVPQDSSPLPIASKKGEAMTETAFPDIPNEVKSGT